MICLELKTFVKTDDNRIGILVDILDKNNYICSNSGFVVAFDVNDYLFTQNIHPINSFFVKVENMESLIYTVRNYSKYKKFMQAFTKCFEDDKIVSEFWSALNHKNIRVSVDKSVVLFYFFSAPQTVPHDSQLIKDILHFKKTDEMSPNLVKVYHNFNTIIPDIRVFSILGIRDRVTVFRDNDIVYKMNNDGNYEVRFMSQLEFRLNDYEKGKEEDLKKFYDSIRFKI